MAWIILIILAAIPLTELFILIDVGQSIGGFTTILLCILSAAIGLQLVRLQGLQVFKNMQEATTRGEPVGDNLIHGFFLMLAGVLLFIPGFLTDLIGGLFLIPPLRLFIAKAGLLGAIMKHSNAKSTSGTIIIEGEYKDQTGWNTRSPDLDIIDITPDNDVSESDKK